MTTRIRFGAAPAIALMVPALLVSAPAWAQNIFDYTYSVGTYTLAGQFSTNATSGAITQANVLSNSYTVYNSGIKQYTISFPGGTTTTGTLTDFIGSNSGTYYGTDDFGYTIGNNHLDPSPAPIDPDYIFDWSLNTTPNLLWYGLSYSKSLDLFSLDENSDVLTPGPQGTSGFASGPVVTGVPEPGSIALLAGLGLSGTAFLRRRRRK